MIARVYDLIIFDCDGVLIDSEKLANRVVADELTKFGVEVTENESLRLFTGMSEDTTSRFIEERTGKPAPGHFHELIHQKTLNVFSKELQAIQGIKQLLTSLSKRKCVASSSSMDRILHSLTLTGLADHFDQGHIFNAQMVENGKPHPDLFLFAASAMKCLPENCLVIEDSVPGIKAAKSAGMDVIGFLGGSHAQQEWYKAKIAQAQPTLLCKDMDEVGKLILDSVI